MLDRLVEAAVASGMAAELSSAGWRKPVGEAYPAPACSGNSWPGVPLTTASDAHRLADVGDRSAELAAQLAALDVATLRAFRRRSPHDVVVGAEVLRP